MATTTMSTSSTMSATSSAASATGTSVNSNDSSSKPLLFFVALGFGVVFTNLWIIVGVKYCFRYNRRARQGLVDGDIADQIGLGNVPRPRRRREKKLMTMEEVNERFPLTKYKLWRSTREQEGLPAAGGISTTPSRAASIKGAALERASTEHDNSIAEERLESVRVNGVGMPATGNEEDSETVGSNDCATSVRVISDPVHDNSDVVAAVCSVKKEDSDSAPVQDSTLHLKMANATAALEETDEKNKVVAGAGITEVMPTPVDEDEDDPIRTALPTELITSPGDSCAICLDILDDDDDVRGLTCGHAFHAGCLDPWLTGRRACCPLCKADYYVPKPRPEGENGNDGQGARSQDGLAAPRPIWPTGRGVNVLRPRMVLSGTRYHADARDRYGFPVWRPVIEPRRNTNNNNLGERRPTEVSMATTASETSQSERRRFRVRYMERLRRISRTGAAEAHSRAMQRRESAAAEAAMATTTTNVNEQSMTTRGDETVVSSENATPTPRQLEAGTR